MISVQKAGESSDSPSGQLAIAVPGKPSESLLNRPFYATLKPPKRSRVEKCNANLSKFALIAITSLK